MKTMLEMDDALPNLTKTAFLLVNDELCFMNTKKGLVKLDIFLSCNLPVFDTNFKAKVNKVSFVMLNFQEVSSKQAKKGNTIDFQLVKWISENK